MAKQIFVKKWFQSKMTNNLSFPNRMATDKKLTVVRETEKAYLVDVYTYGLGVDWDGYVSVWVPKSCVQSDEERAAEDAKEAQRETEQEARYNNGCEKYAKLIEWCKANNVKGVRSGLRKETIMNKIAAAGLVYEY